MKTIDELLDEANEIADRLIEKYADYDDIEYVAEMNTDNVIPTDCIVFLEILSVCRDNTDEQAQDLMFNRYTFVPFVGNQSDFAEFSNGISTTYTK